MMERGGSEARAQLKRLATIVAGQSPSSETVYPLEECPTCLPFIQGSAEFGPRFPHPRYACPQSPKRCQPQDLLLSVRAPVGDLNQAEAELGIGRGVAAVRSDKLLHGYLWYVLEAFGHQLDAVARGSTYASIGAEDIGRLEIPYPHKEEQRRIADYLDRETQRLDELLDHNGTLLGRLRERWERIVFQGVTTGSMDGSAGTTELSGDWFGAVPSHWRAAQYRWLAEIGTGHTPSRSEPAYWQECDIPWLTTADVRRFREDEVERIRETTHKISELGLRHSAAVKHPAGSVAMSRTASVGFSVILDQEAAVSQDFVVWRPSAQMLPEYLLWSLRAMRYVGHLDRLMMGSTHKTIYWDALSAIGGPVPPVEEQRQVVADIREAVSDIATLRSSLLRQADLLRERRRALITAALTGELDVGEAV